MELKIREIAQDFSLIFEMKQKYFREVLPLSWQSEPPEPEKVFEQQSAFKLAKKRKTIEQIRLEEKGKSTLAGTHGS